VNERLSQVGAFRRMEKLVFKRMSMSGSLVWMLLMGSADRCLEDEGEQPTISSRQDRFLISTEFGASTWTKSLDSEFLTGKTTPTPKLLESPPFRDRDTLGSTDS
jgi:hypothetical protein